MTTTTLKEYLQTHSKNSVNNESLHDKLVNDVVAGLKRLIGDEPEEVYRKVELIEENGAKIDRLDLVVLASDEIYIIKTRNLSEDRRIGRGTGLNRMKQDLLRDYEFIKRRFEVISQMIAVYRNLGSRDFQHYNVPRPLEDLIASLK